MDRQQASAGQAGRQTGEVKQTGMRPAKHTETDRQAGRQVINYTQGEAGRHPNLSPSVPRQRATSGLSEAVAATPGPECVQGGEEGGGRGGCGESSPAAPPTEQLAPPQRE